MPTLEPCLVPSAAHQLRVLLTTQPGTGHLNSMVPLARALTAAGHEVAFATGATFCSTVEAAGFRAIPAGLDFLQSAAASAFPELASLAGEKASVYWLKSVWLDAAPKRMLPDLLRVIRDWKPAVVVHDFWDFAAPLAAEAAGIPYAVHVLSCFRPVEMLARFFGMEFRLLRELAGLPPDPHLAYLYRYLYLDYYPPGLQPTGPVVPAVVHHIRPGPFETPGVEAPGWLMTLPRRPTVYVSMGTVFSDVPELFKLVLRGLRDEDTNVIVTLGSPDRDPSDLGPPPDNARIESFVAQPLILQRSDLLVTHAGPNAIVEALSNGLPMLCIPLSAEQPVNARNCEQAGIALSLDLADLTPERVKLTVRRLLTEGSFKSNARWLQTELQQLPDSTHAVRLLERLACTRRPVPSC